MKFKATRSAVLLAWGGHLAQSAYWDRSRGGPSDGAAMVSGAPWHMRTLQLDGSGNKNQDRSIQPSAIVGELPPFALAPPTPAPRNNPPANPPPANPRREPWRRQPESAWRRHDGRRAEPGWPGRHGAADLDVVEPPEPESGIAMAVAAALALTAAAALLGLRRSARQALVADRRRRT